MRTWGGIKDAYFVLFLRLENCVLASSNVNRALLGLSDMAANPTLRARGQALPMLLEPWLQHRARDQRAFLFSLVLSHGVLIRALRGSQT